MASVYEYYSLLKINAVDVERDGDILKVTAEEYAPPTPRPPTPTPTTNDIVLFRNTADRNRVSKMPYLTEVGTIKGVIREATSIVNLVLTIQYPKVIDFNYIFFGALNRYYFVDNIISVSNNLWELSLTVDVLMSYRDALLNLPAFIDRNERFYNPNIIDKKLPIEQGVNVTVYPIDNSVFNKDGGLFIPEKAVRFVLNGYKLNSFSTNIPQESEVE